MSIRFDEHFLKGALSQVTCIAKNFPKDVSFSIDSRTLKKGDIFIAVEGAQFDSHTVITEVLQGGACGVFLNESKKEILDTIDAQLLKNKLIVLVENTVDALIAMATAWRAQFDYPVVAITGSVGKTSTKEMVSNILTSHNTKHIASFGNQNTRIGLSLNVLKMSEDLRAAVFEVGISRRGDMSRLIDILKPTIALITSVGHSHMEGLGSLADIAAEKREVFKYFTNESIGIINGDLPILSDVGYDHPVIKFGCKTTNQIQARKINVGNGVVDFVIKIYHNKYKVQLQSAHSGMVYNALAAASIGYLLGVSDEHIVKGIEVPVQMPSRFEKRSLSKGKGVLINDCYNASPESMKAALLAIEQVDTDAKKIAVLGDMLELGVNSPFWHRQLGRILRKTPSLRHVILVGQLVSWTKKTVPIGVKVEHVESWDIAVKKLNSMMDKKNESLVLVKGSNSMNLIKLVDHFTS